MSMSKKPHSRLPPTPPTIAAPPLPAVTVVVEKPAVQVQAPPRATVNFANYLRQTGIVVCSLFIVLFIVLSYSAVRTKSATYDEPVHGLAAWANLRLGDFRINFEDPPLWKYWAALPNSASSIKFNDKDEVWVDIPKDVYRGWEVANRTLYQTRGNEGGAFINRERFMMVLLGGALGVVLALWAWQLGGPVAAMIATGLYALDPNLLAHAGMIKNDVPMALLMTAVFFSCWQVGKKLTIANVIILSLLVAIAVNTKFSALLLAPMLILIIAIRAALPLPWTVLGRTLPRLLPRAAAAAILLVTIALVSYFGIWASYGFRYNPTPNPDIQLNTQKHKSEAIKYSYQAKQPLPKIPAFDASIPLRQDVDELREQIRRFQDLGNQVQQGLKTADLSESSRTTIQNTLLELNKLFAQCEGAYQQTNSFLVNTPPPDQRAANYGEQYAKACQVAYNGRALLMDREYDLRLLLYWLEVGDTAPDSFIRFLNIFFDHHLLPSAWLNGVLFVHSRSIVRSGYLLGQTSNTGWWYYFPLAMLFKSPVATVVTLICTLVLGVWLALQKRKEWLRLAWPVGCLVVPFAVYMVSAMGSNLNIGIRHILPVFPVTYITCGVLLAIAVKRWNKPILIAFGAVGLMLACETLLRFPNYLSYFNFVFRPYELTLLADSNLDWGQDLPLLAQWQKQHPNVPIAFGPWMRAEAPSGSYFGTVDPAYYGIEAHTFYANLPNPPDLPQTHVLVVSATLLQGVYGGHYKEFFKGKTPSEVLGDTIYLYDLRPKK